MAKTEYVESTCDTFVTEIVAAETTIIPPEQMQRARASGFSEYTHEPLQRYASTDTPNNCSTWTAVRRDEVLFDRFTTPVLEEEVRIFPRDQLSHVQGQGYSATTHRPLIRIDGDDEANGESTWNAARLPQDSGSGSIQTLSKSQGAGGGSTSNPNKTGGCGGMRVGQRARRSNFE